MAGMVWEWENWCQTPKEMIKTLDEIGWFANCSGYRRRLVVMELIKDFNEKPSSAFYALATCSFDTECIDDESSYPQMLKYFARKSWGKFTPTKINSVFRYKDEKPDEFDFGIEEMLEGKVKDENDGTAAISFVYNKKKHSVEIGIYNDWFNFKALDFVNKVIREAGHTEQFIPLPARDQCAELVFVSPEIFQKAIELKLIPDGDGFDDSY